MQNKFAAIAMIMVLMIGMTGFAAATEDVTVSIGDGNGTVTIPIMIENVTDLGSCHIRLDFDETVVDVTAVTDGQMANMVSNIHSSDGWVRIGAWQGNVGGLTGDVIFANVTFTPADGCPMGNSDLNLTVTTLKDATPQGQVIPRDIDNGIYTSMLNGDVNNDGNVDFADVDYLANNIVGSTGYPIVCPIVADVDGSGDVDIADVNYLANYLVGDLDYDPLK